VGIPTLLVTCESTWLAPIRMPAALHRAGFDVTLLAPDGAVAAYSRYVTRSRTLPATANAQEWLFALIAAIDATAPDIVLPGDEMTLRLMQGLVTAPPPVLSPHAARALSDLVERSLGAPEFYDAGTDKARLAPLMQRAGVRVPDYAVVRSVDEAVRAARELGPDVVLKPSNGTGGRDVIPCDSPQAAAAAFHRVLAGNRRAAAFDREPTVLVQRRIDGQMVGRSAVAFRGVELAGFTRERLRAMAARGGSTVVRYLHVPEPAAFSRRIAGTLGITGFVTHEFCVERQTGHTYLIDLTRRMAPPTHTGSLVGVDLCVALAAALRGDVGTPLDLPEGYAYMMTLFPQELWRDARSPALHEYPMDVPWDDPALLHELLHWRYDIDA